jgi:hypothetical protein
MVVWSGWGFLGLVIFAGLAFGNEYLFGALGGLTAVGNYSWLLGIAWWLVGSALCWVVGRWANRERDLRVFDIHFTGHSMMGVRLDFAGIILGGGLLLLLGFFALLHRGFTLWYAM